ncbi:GNAT family N-acetyltransferase [Paracoccus sp. S1E-3]|uniref:GNAT family N-acetyltransferase n=1 Tax=Paracoccus sp. S1E-3 TaxID=2756130 RepID=UPI0015EF5DF0|nr:GNAT family N-acetyltransferase [Paracoccus sp. S1E-3]MBA4490754.1 GNAT family N-acetyltransferase [Paracoccus sp. S1E-3]
MSAPAIRPANVNDAAFLLPLVDAAGEGIPAYVWSTMAAPGQDPREIGMARIGGNSAAVSWRNAWVAELDAVPAGCLFTYAQPERPEPVPADLPPIFVPLQELENEAPATGYVYILATHPDMQGRGVGRALLRFAERWRGPRGMSLIVADNNLPAIGLYQSEGYQVAAQRRIVTNGWRTKGQNWLLMLKP